MENTHTTIFTKRVLVAVILLLLVSQLFSFLSYRRSQEELRTVSEFVANHSPEIDGAVLSFFQLFVDDVFKKEGAVGYPTRAALDQYVTTIGDAELSSAWNFFLSSTSEAQAQQAVVRMLSRVSVLLSG